MKIKLLIVALSLVAGFSCGYFSPRKIYIDMLKDSGGWWIAWGSKDGFKCYTSGDEMITIKTFFKIQDEPINDAVPTNGWFAPAVALMENEKGEMLECWSDGFYYHCSNTVTGVETKEKIK